MTADPPRRWRDDSPEEDAEAHRAAEMGRLERRMAWEKARPLADALGAHGAFPADAESWAGAVIMPDWWNQVPEPHDQCMWCQRPGVASPCGECRAARQDAADPPAAWAWWARLTPAQQRLNIAARFGTDPWTGRPARIEMEWTDAGQEGITITRDRYLGCTPDGIYWQARRRALR
jgi:hypothetical protein